MAMNFIETVEDLCLSPCERIDKYIILNRRETPVKMMGLEKDIEYDDFYFNHGLFIERINQLYNENEVSEMRDGKITNFYSIPIGYYTDYDGGYPFKSGRCNYVIFEETSAIDEKKKTVKITSAAENAINYIKNFSLSSMGCLVNFPSIAEPVHKPAVWVSSRFFAMVFKVGYTTYDGYLNYKYRNISEDTHSYVRVSYLGVDNHERYNRD